ncbi:MAG: IS5 family transposase [Phycisphaerae bacterium]
MAKVRYRVRNWPAYNRALVNRYRLEVWLSEDVARGWYARPTGRRGRPPVYSDTAIAFCLTIRALFDLPLRGCQGFLESARIGLGLAVPDYSVMCRRAPGLEVKFPVRHRGERLHLLVDSSGLKVYGEGEWKVRAHGWSRRRTWRKLHIGVDEETGEVLVARLTEAGDFPRSRLRSRAWAATGPTTGRRSGRRWRRGARRR